MKFSIATFAFAILFVIFFSWSAQSEPTDLHIQSTKFLNDLELSLQEHYSLYKDDTVLLNFSHSVISQIGPDFIASPLITNLYLSNNHIQMIEKNAFRKLPNLTSLFLSNNNFTSNDLFSFGNHTKLKTLIMNNLREKSDNNYYYNYHTTTYIQEYPNLEILSLRGNDVTNLRYSSQDDQQCGPNSRYCLPTLPLPKLILLDLSKNKLSNTEFMESLSNTLLYLDLESNAFDSIRLYKKGENLVLLNADNNNLHTVASSNCIYHYSCLELANLNNLSYLSVSANRIESVQSDTFKDTDKLIYLNMSRNEIKSLYSETFATLQHLRTLDLSFNKFKNVPEVLNTIQIKILSLRQNMIEEINSNAFVQMPKLTKLLLGENRIDWIDKEAFADLTSLEELDLSENKLSYLPEGWAESLVSLKYLDLSGNNFTSLESLSLTSTIPLTELNFATNPLEYLNVRYFENLPQNLTVHLIPDSDFINRWLQVDPDSRYYFLWLRTILE